MTTRKDFDVPCLYDHPPSLRSFGGQARKDFDVAARRCIRRASQRIPASALPGYLSERRSGLNLDWMGMQFRQNTNKSMVKPSSD